MLAAAVAAEPALRSGQAKPPAFSIRTWGCQMNVHDSEKMAGVLTRGGFASSHDARGADVVLLNTCAVRDKATQKVYHALGRLRRLKEQNPSMIIGVTGCVAQLEGETIFRRAPYVDLVVGPRAIGALPRLVAEARSRQTLRLTPVEDDLTYPFESAVRGSAAKAYVTVMEGCDKACTFCIVPKTRGDEEYRPVAQVLAEAAHLAGRGYREIELLGQNVNGYRHGGVDFAGLLRLVDAVDGIERLRFTTSHPLHLSDAIIAAMAEGEHICPQIHLPVQSGSDRVLRRMRRGYDRARYLERVARLRAEVAGVALSTDVIVGFPGESDTDFEATMEMLDEVRFEQVYSFVYSPRPGTVAARLEDPTPAAVKDARLQHLQRRQQEIQAELYSRQLGRTVPVLVEGPAKFGEGVYSGRSPQNFVVLFSGHEGMVGRILPVSIQSVTSLALYGEVDREAALAAGISLTSPGTDGIDIAG
jgi:tRNA-2-methylthio-N6-dimethylallyladenosine synthase